MGVKEHGEETCRQGSCPEAKMTNTPNRMTDAAYEKALRDAEKQVSVIKTENIRAQSAWDNTSVRKCGIWEYLATWLQLQKSARQLRKNQAHLNFLLEFERERNKG
jgi:hypothetical protein